jgi:NAD(P)-dependent dehydrogenase (short-subunit alcohol dehydrogenase family)
MVSTLGGAHYTASKAGLFGLTRAAAKELGKFGITVNAICPGMIAPVCHPSLQRIIG